jgi:uncharacterized protein YjbK
MIKIVMTIFLTLGVASLFAASEVLIEHQIRLCDSDEVILKALQINKKDLKLRKIYYIENIARDLKTKNYTLRLKGKNSKVEVDLKKRILDKQIPDIFNNGNCEIDKHANVLEQTCKSSNEVSETLLKSVIKGEKEWSDILSKEQLNWLSTDQLYHLDPKIYGTLVANRGEANHKELGVITLDLVEVENHQDVKYHEISIRYPLSELSKKSSLFEAFVKDLSVKVCDNQIDWEINKFDILSPM